MTIFKPLCLIILTTLHVEEVYYMEATDIILGILLIIKNKISKICSLQILLILAYTLLLTYLKPILWLDPLGPIFKNIPIILLTLVLMAIERDK